MKIQTFLEHHGVTVNPFADEEAQTDPVFKDHCIFTTYHPSWDKIYGDPIEPSTSIVFGEKGAGKTALRLQIVRHLQKHNKQNPDAKLFVIQYDDLNPFLDRFRDRFSTRRDEKALAHWRLWDHMDALLAIGTTRLVNLLLGRPADLTPGLGGTALPEEASSHGRFPKAVAGESTLSGSAQDATEGTGENSAAAFHTPPSGQPIDPTTAELLASIAKRARHLDRTATRDVLLLAACYDQSISDTFCNRWHTLRKRLGFSTWMSYWDRAVGILGTLVVLGVTFASGNWAEWFQHSWVYLLVVGCWLPWAWRWTRRYWMAWKVVRQLRTANRSVEPLQRVLMHLSDDELVGQPLPTRPRSDDRYEMLAKFQGVLGQLGYRGIVILVDRLDEPDLMNGSTERMRLVLWPLLVNKFLKLRGIGVKMLLPVELTEYIDREGPEFYERSRLDKQNMIRSLEWTGEALYDVANARLRACTSNSRQSRLRDWFDPSITDARLLEAFRMLRVPRNLFKFIYRALVAHCNAHTDSDPAWTISPEIFEATLALYRRDQEAFERGGRAV